VTDPYEDPDPMPSDTPCSWSITNATGEMMQLTVWTPKPGADPEELVFVSPFRNGETFVLEVPAGSYDVDGAGFDYCSYLVAAVRCQAGVAMSTTITRADLAPGVSAETAARCKGGPHLAGAGLP
jgi:hypothetical protein